MVFRDRNVVHEVLVVLLALEVGVLLRDGGDLEHDLLRLLPGHVLPARGDDLLQRLRLVRVVLPDAAGELMELVEPGRKVDVDRGLRRVDLLFEGDRPVPGAHDHAEPDENDAYGRGERDKREFHFFSFLS